MVLAAVLAALVPVLMVIGADRAYACSCTPAREATHYAGAGAVFVGTLLGRVEPQVRGATSSGDRVTLRFRVSRVYKGSVHGVQEVTTARSGASCGIAISGAEPLLVFANGRPDGPGLLTAGLCGGTRPLAFGAALIVTGWLLLRRGRRAA